MSPNRELNPMESLWDLAAVTLHRLRIDRSLSLQGVGDLIGVHRSNVAKVEGGLQKLQQRHAEILDAKWGTGGILRSLVHHAKTRHNSSWEEERAELEGRSTYIRAWYLGWIHGLFQTEDYARAEMIRAGHEDVEKAVRQRLKRQEILSRPDAPYIRAYIAQEDLEDPVGGPETQRAQLARLLELAENPKISIRVLPRGLGGHVGRDGSFHIMTVDGLDVAYCETIGPGRLIRDVSEVRMYAQFFDQIGDVALPVRESLDLIRAIMEGLA